MQENKKDLPENRNVCIKGRKKLEWEKNTLKMVNEILKDVSSQWSRENPFVSKKFSTYEMP